MFVWMFVWMFVGVNHQNMQHELNNKKKIIIIIILQSADETSYINRIFFGDGT